MVNDYVAESTEEWKPVVGWESYYEVSNLGRLKSLRSGKCMALHANGFGYLGTMLTKDGKSSTKRIHCLVAESFLGPKPDGLCINHIDGVKDNNAAINLEYTSSAANTIHAIRSGLWKGQIKLSPQDVENIKRDSVAMKQQQIAKKYNIINQSQVSRILGGHRRRLTA